MGSFNEDMFKNSFGFVKELQHKERREIEKAVETETNEYKKESIKQMLQRMVNFIRFDSVYSVYL